jgi:hypothetical protein
MAISQFATITDAVLTILRADANLSAVTISDGLPITEDRLVDLVIIGNSGNPEDSRSGTITQEWHDLAGINSTRDETVQIFCAILTFRLRVPEPSKSWAGCLMRSAPITAAASPT